MNRLSILLSVIFMLPLSSCYNVVPTYPIDIASPATQVEIDRVSDVAQELGFIQLSNVATPNPYFGGERPAVGVRQWVWSTRRWTYIALFKLVDRDRYRVVFVDTHTDGSALMGAPCRKYLEFVSALKSRFGPDNNRLTFASETCDQRGIEPE